MAHRKTPQRETVRDDPEETTLTPSDNLLILCNPDGSSLTRGKHNDRFQYCWVNKSNDIQFARYLGLMYRPCRYAVDEVRPQVAMWTEYENTDEKENALIERAGVVLMKRPIKYMHMQEAATRKRAQAYATQMDKINPAAQRRAKAAGSVIRNGEFETDTAFGM